jgi:hypothetical protein
MNLPEVYDLLEKYQPADLYVAPEDMAMALEASEATGVAVIECWYLETGNAFLCRDGRLFPNLVGT